MASASLDRETGGGGVLELGPICLRFIGVLDGIGGANFVYLGE